MPKYFTILSPSHIPLALFPDPQRSGFRLFPSQHDQALLAMFRYIIKPTRASLRIAELPAASSLIRPLHLSAFSKPTLPLSSLFLTRSFRSQSFPRLQQQPPSPTSAKPQSPPRITEAQYRELSEQIRFERHKKGAHSAAYYSASVIVLFLTLAYAAVPLYRIVCQQSGFMGAPVAADPSKFSSDKLVPVDYKRRIRVSFSGTTSTTMPWSFVPQQREVHVLPGETALAFYKAKNPTKRDIVGMATYSVVPEKAAPYFSKIQCFCFEEQKLSAGEEVDMPVFFFIDPDFAFDPLMRNVDDIILNYTFFQARQDDNGSLIPMSTQEAISAANAENEDNAAPVVQSA